MSSPPPSLARAPRTRPPSIDIPPTGAKTPGTPPTAAGDAFRDVNADVESQFDETDEDTDQEDDDDDDEPIVVLPYGEVHQKKKSAKMFGFQRSTKKKVSDPFDFLEKLPEDPEYQEMGETARLWKIFLQERGKVDADKVANWKDALDVLLVFAGLFSAVVSSFVTQTYQSLQVDNVSIAVHLIVELVGVQRAFAHGDDVDDVPATDLTPLTDFRPARSATWVNGLWFVSLVLSLTAALIAVLTKQWVNEYLDSAQVGTPRTLSRIRQFRAVQLEVWQVPVIIGMLPVLMHVSLGVFIAGLIIFLFTLSTPLTIAVSLVAAGMMATYLSTNILPLYNPSCPYKTPLTNYVYSFYHYLCHLELRARWNSLIRWLKREMNEPESVPSHDEQLIEEDQGHPMPSSLKEAEEQIVTADADCLDAQVAVWLYDTSANSAIHRVVLEALSNASLNVLNLVTQKLEELESFVTSAIQSIDCTVSPNIPVYQRLMRTSLRVSPEPRPALLAPAVFDRTGFSLPILLTLEGSEQAAKYVAAEIVTPTAKHDTVIWVQILRNALCCASGPDFLFAGKGGSDPLTVWHSLVDWMSAAHDCAECRQGSAVHDCPIYEVSLDDISFNSSHANYANQLLTVLDDSCPAFSPDTVTSRHAITLQVAMSRFFMPSFSTLMLKIHKFPNCSTFQDVPQDVHLALCLIRHPDVQCTSNLHDDASLARKLIMRIQITVEVLHSRHILRCHPKIIPATFETLQGLVADKAFAMQFCPVDQRELLSPFFRCLVLDPKLAENTMDHGLCEKILGIVFWNVDCITPSIVILLHDALRSSLYPKCTGLLPGLYARLRQHHWVDGLYLIGLRVDHIHDTLYEAIHDNRSMSFMAMALLDGLTGLKEISPFEYEQTLAYICQPENVLALSQLLLLSDTKRQRALWRLADVVPSAVWVSCLHQLRDFAEAMLHRNYTLLGVRTRSTL